MSLSQDKFIDYKIFLHVFTNIHEYISKNFKYVLEFTWHIFLLKKHPINVTFMFMFLLIFLKAVRNFSQK